MSFARETVTVGKTSPDFLVVQNSVPSHLHDFHDRRQDEVKIQRKFGVFSPLLGNSSLFSFLKTLLFIQQCSISYEVKDWLRLKKKKKGKRPQKQQPKKVGGKIDTSTNAMWSCSNKQSLNK